MLFQTKKNLKKLKQVWKKIKIIGVNLDPASWIFYEVNQTTGVQ
jgi:hypothetical protein